MGGIFISYANEDQDRVAPIIRALETHGWSTWWDRRILLVVDGGPSQYTEITKKESCVGGKNRA